MSIDYDNFENVIQQVLSQSPNEIQNIQYLAKKQPLENYFRSDSASQKVAKERLRKLSKKKKLDVLVFGFLQTVEQDQVYFSLGLYFAPQDNETFFNERIATAQLFNVKEWFVNLGSMVAKLVGTTFTQPPGASISQQPPQPPSPQPQPVVVEVRTKNLSTNSTRSGFS